MEDKILEILLDMKKDINEMKDDIKDVNNKLDKLEYKINDSFETLEIISENNISELTRIKVRVSKLEKRIIEKM